MPSRNKSTAIHDNKKINGDVSVVFFPLATLTLIMWYLYRALFKFPVWFDETIGKAIFFGLPVWLYISISDDNDIADTFSSSKLKVGLLLGITVGGVFGFVFSLLAIIQGGAVVEAVSLFDSPKFWYEFALALFTSFWETLLFFSFMMTVIRKKFKDWSMLAHIVLVAMIFVVFHIPNTILRFDPTLVLAELFVLMLFAVGQGFLFYTTRNSYALIISQAIWGMVLLVNTGF